MVNIHYLRESPGTWEIVGHPSRDQRIRPRSWRGKKKSKRKGRKFYRDQEENTYQNGSWRRSGVECRSNTEGVKLGSPDGKKSWRELKTTKIIVQNMLESLVPAAG